MSKPKFDPNKPFEIVDQVSTAQSAPKPKFNPEAAFEVVQEGNPILETAQDVGIAAAQGATAGFSDEMIGAGVTAFKKATGDKRPFQDLYEEARNSVREMQETGQSRSPVLSFIADMAGGMANPAGKLVKGASTASRYARGVMAPKSIGQAAASGAVQGLGYSDQEGVDAIPQAAIGASLGTASQGILGFLGSKFSKPDEVRASALGAGKKAFKVKGPQKRQPVVAQLKDLDFYSLAPKAWDPEKRKFVSSRLAEGMQGDGVADTYMNRALDAIDKLSQENQALLAGVKVQPQDLDSAIAKTISQSNKGTLPETAQKEAEAFLNQWVVENLLPGPISAKNLESLKRNIQEEVSSTYKNMGTNDIQLARKKDLLVSLASNLKDTLERVAPDATYAENNKIMSALFTQKSDLEDLIAKEAAQSGKGFRGAYETVTGVIDDMTGGTSREMVRASAGDLLNRYANVAKILGAGVQQAPQKAAFTAGEPEQMQGRNPDAIQDQARNYNFQRVKSMMSQPLPRSSDELINNAAARNLLISKTYHMVGPETAQILERQFEMFKPQQMKPVLQKFMTDNPSLFDADEYNRVDGVITDDVMKQKAINELSKRKDISAIQRARMTDAIINNKRNVVWPKSQE